MSEFVEQLSETFADFGSIYSKRMFGGHGIYHERLMFALVTDDVLYLKTDGELANDLKALGAKPFQFMRSGKVVSTSYYEAPPSIFEDHEEAAMWAQRAYRAAVAAQR